MTRRSESTPAIVPDVATQAGEAARKWDWVEPSVWTVRMLTALQSRFAPNKVVLLRPETSEPPPITRLAPYTAGQGSVGGKATAYVCTGHACKAPTTDPGEMVKALLESVGETKCRGDGGGQGRKD